MSFILKTVGKCSLLTVISIKDIRFAVENHPQNLPFSVLFFLFMSIIMKTVGKCSLLTVISIKDIRFAVENHPQNLPFSVIFFSFISIILKTVGKCSLLTVISIKDIRFAVENHPQVICFKIKILFKYRFGRIPVLCKICRFRSFFFFVYLNYYENCWEMFTFKGYKHQGHSVCSQKPPSKFVIGAFFRQHQGHSICSRKPPSKFVIGAFFRLVMLYKETKKKFQKSINNSKNTYLFGNSTIHR
ncbi:hypothetical protein AGLY_018179 [Aphis glycines]|uniref:Uncharacterized protein n=1 Tax=Aphis glycines TaxID=307491 RepID=A0A6G0SSU1_APHGL|nr:hypothetical protein AGLY_018179 [Aphis glycines]